MDTFVFWLGLESTLVTVVVPMILGVVGFAEMSLHGQWRREIFPGAVRLVLIASLCIPLMHATSFWDGNGLHIAPLELVPFLYMVSTRGLDMRRQWFAVGFASWFSAVVVDVFGAYLANYPGSTWYWSVGGYGYDDGLFVGPLATVVSLFAAQAIRERWYFAPMSVFNLGRA
ncbi:hypothetical protein ACG04R_16470 [Roseateles sp. BYS78W]|uniref:Uncharacterized protein n=1 Tax=Pelomonas candidula TaxID=3299025 RepID=A0ABW7HF32_9BURK